MTTDDRIEQLLEEVLGERSRRAGAGDDGFATVMAAVLETPQRGRGRFPTGRSVVSMMSPLRVAAMLSVLALVAAGWFVAPALFEGPPPEPYAQLSMSAAPSPEPSTDSVEAERELAAVATVATLQPGADPAMLAAGPFGEPVFVDRASGEASQIGDDGYAMRLVPTPGLSDMAEPRLAFGAGEWIYVVDADGRAWLTSRGQQSDSPELSPADGFSARAETEEEPTRIDPSTTVVAVDAVGPDAFDIHLAEPTTGAILTYAITPEEPELLIDDRLGRDGSADVRGLYADGHLWVLTDDGIEHWVEGEPDITFGLADVPGDAALRYLTGVGDPTSGRLWSFDTRGRRFVAFEKADGSYVSSWSPPSGAPGLDDVRGFYAESSAGGDTVLTWITPAGLVRAAVSDPLALAAEAPVDEGLVTGDRPASRRAIVWATDEAELRADTVRIDTGKKVFKARGPVVVDLDNGDFDASLEMTWFEHGVEMRLFIYLANDGKHWWVYDFWTYDGRKNGEWIYFTPRRALTRTPMGQALEGDLRLESTGGDRKAFRQPGTATLEIEGLRLAAFEPRTLLAPLSGCEYVDVPDDALSGRDFDWGLGPGEPLDGLMEMAPGEAEARLQELGWCYRFEYRFRVENPFAGTKLAGHYWPWASDLRCSAPTSGAIAWASVGPDRRAGQMDDAIVTVIVEDRTLHDASTVPPHGTDCEPLEAS